ncbi:hypothetical protein KQX54_015830 [Cotesia glomerata]|uniref:Uncharacterized protein n=1 Tax=Cotesia glomerata TaxID=32391 RepID=A0AAV7J9S3_COTGL|nr:hypothetical protein KQX54_015830 [Cotesia glomerata]
MKVTGIVEVCGFTVTSSPALDSQVTYHGIKVATSDEEIETGEYERYWIELERKRSSVAQVSEIHIRLAVGGVDDLLLLSVGVEIVFGVATLGVACICNSIL